MKSDILEAISKNSAFGIDDVHKAYETFKSYDILISACELSNRTGYSNLLTACILVKYGSSNSEHEQEGE